MPDPIPVALLACLVVDRAYQGRGFGRGLFRDGAGRVAHAADAIGIRESSSTPFPKRPGNSISRSVSIHVLRSR